MLTENVSKIVSMGYKGKQLNKVKEQTIYIKNCFRKNYAEDRINDSTQERKERY